MSATEELPPPRTRREMKERGILLTTEIPVVPEPPGWDEAVAAGTWVGEEAVEPDSTTPARRGRHTADDEVEREAEADELAASEAAPADAEADDVPAGYFDWAAAPAPKVRPVVEDDSPDEAAPGPAVTSRRAIHRPAEPAAKIPRVGLGVRTAGTVFVLVVVAVLVFLISNGSLGTLVGGDEAEAAVVALVGARALVGSGFARRTGRRDR